MLGRQGWFWQVLCKCVLWGFANAACSRASLSAAHQPVLKSCSSSALSKCSTELYCSLKPLNWSALNRLYLAGCNGEKAHFSSLPIFPVTSDNCLCFFLCSSFALRILKSLYFIILAAMSCLSGTILKGCTMVWYLHTSPDRRVFFPPCFTAPMRCFQRMSLILSGISNLSVIM